MIVIEQLENIQKHSDKTLHTTEREKRFNEYKNLLSNVMLYCFVVDTKHKNGLEVHCINKNGLIYIHNKRTRKLVTILHPRPAQLKRYFKGLNIDIPNDIKKLANKCYQRNNVKQLNKK